MKCVLRGAVFAASLVALVGCDTLTQNVAIGTAGFAAYGALVPANEIEQVYYLGTFDPQGQIPLTVYRVRVRGQSSLISGTKFASGWLPAEVVDSLNTHIGFDVNDKSKPNVQISKTEDKLSEIQTGRRMMQFGPEGFRRVPEAHRLIIAMGQTPRLFLMPRLRLSPLLKNCKIRKPARKLNLKSSMIWWCCAPFGKNWENWMTM